MNIEKLAKHIVDMERVSIAQYLDNNNRVVNMGNDLEAFLFWYRNDDDKLQSLSRELKIIDPNRKLYPPPTGKRNVKQNHVCLYVDDGTNLDGGLEQQGRLSQHLLPGTPENIYNEGSAPKNNVSQFRTGFDFLYRDQPKTIIFDEIRERIDITILGKRDPAICPDFRGYLIGILEPWCNLFEER